MDLWMGHFHDHFHGIVERPLLPLDLRHVHKLLLLLRNVHVNNFLNVEVVVTFLRDDLGHVHLALLRHGHRHVHELLDRYVHKLLLLVGYVDVHNLLDMVMMVTMLL